MGTQPASTVLRVLLSQAEVQLSSGKQLYFNKAGTTSPNPQCPQVCRVLSRQHHPWPVPLPAGQLAPRHALAPGSFYKFIPPRVFLQKKPRLFTPWGSLFLREAEGKGEMAAPEGIGIARRAA